MTNSIDRQGSSYKLVSSVPGGLTLKVTVVFLGRASEIARRSLVEVELPEESTVLDLLKKLGDEIHPDLFRRFIEGHYVFVTYINGVPTIDPSTKLKDGDRVTFITPEMGG
ncbi:MAG: MoaD/ThiS family protein [Desulfurococcaceae archaeon]